MNRPEQTEINYCSHYVLGECSQDHHTNCVGMTRCIRELEEANEKLKRKLENLKDDFEYFKEQTAAANTIQSDSEESKIKELQEKLKFKEKETERLKQGIKHFKRGMHHIINTANECRNNKEWEYKENK